MAAPPRRRARATFFFPYQIDPDSEFEPWLYRAAPPPRARAVPPRVFAAVVVPPFRGMLLLFVAGLVALRVAMAGSQIT